jgi:hypothetical protein
MKPDDSSEYPTGAWETKDVSVIYEAGTRRLYHVRTVKE